MTKERPILFSGGMVRAILAGTKTQTRRIVKSSTEFKGPYSDDYLEAHKRSDGWAKICPYGAIGDHLWVREAFRLETLLEDLPPSAMGSKETLRYEADGFVRGNAIDEFGRLRPSIHMPRSASRITLEVTGVRVERLGDISEEDAKAEGVRGYVEDGCFVYEDYICGPGTWSFSAKGSFISLWDSINAKRAPWSSNPWVWVVENKLVSG